MEKVNGSRTLAWVPRKERRHRHQESADQWDSFATILALFQLVIGALVA
jgi:hypothetical protein